MTAPNFDEAVRAILKTDSELYKTIKEAYEYEQHDGNPSEMDKHIYGTIAAVNAVYILGHSTGYTRGYSAAVADRQKEGK